MASASPFSRRFFQPAVLPCDQPSGVLGSPAARYATGARGFALVAAGLLFAALVALLDYRTGPYLSFSVLYLIPVGACAWWGGFPHGTLVAIGGTVAWHAVDVLKSPQVPPAVGLWNDVARFGTLILVSSLVARLHAGILRERWMARTDPLTGAANGRTFYEAAAAEAERSCRASRALTLAYLDLDDFKQLNDRHGHAVGDRALLHVVETIRLNVRRSDLLARLGGDEFALLLPETGPEGAVALLDRVQHLVARETAGKGWPVTVSIGAVTFLRPAWDVDLMVQRVDAQMYAAKRKGKARIEHAVVCEAQDATTAGEPSRERRATARVVCNQPAAVHPEADGRGAFATIRDLSVGGVGLLLGEQYPLGTVLVVEPMTRGARTLLARVVRSAPVEGGWFHGCELSTRLEEDELRRWLENRPAKTV